MSNSVWHTLKCPSCGTTVEHVGTEPTIDECARRLGVEVVRFGGKVYIRIPIERGAYALREVA